MRKNKNYLFVLLFICVLATLSDKIVYAQEKCNVDIFKNIVVQKGKKVKLYSNTYCKIKWKSSSRKVKINKKGMLKAKKKGKVKILGKTEDGFPLYFTISIGI